MSNWVVPVNLKTLPIVPVCLAAVVLLAGCEPERPVVFEPNLVHAMKYQLKEDMPTDQAAEDAFWVVTEMFGTPDAPQLPAIVTEDEDLASVVSMDNLWKASGPADAVGRGLYRKHCANCHGVTGDGRGSLAATLNPYPRDYRKGVFKFKSTERGAKPTREDLHGLIKNGIPGSAMVVIDGLTDEDADALVDYVIYLSWRGELERTLMDMAIFDLDLGEGDRIIDPAGRAAVDESLQEAFEDSWADAEEYATDIGEAWAESDDEIVDVPDPPSEFPVADSYEQFVALSKGETAEAMMASVERGRTLFNGKIAACSKCHGENGAGGGQTTDYDDWTKDWTTAAGFKPEDREALIPMMARGAMTPVNANPRNFSVGVFHGGQKAADLYRRITQGIEGSPMPAVTFVDGEFEEVDVWHLINYVRSLKVIQEPTPLPTEVAAAN